MGLELSNAQKTVIIRAELEDKLRSNLIECLRAYFVVFSWSHEDMPRIDPSHVCHKLVNRDIVPSTVK